MTGRVVHLIGSLEIGGAETVLCRLLESADREQLPMHVLTLRPGGPLVERVRSCGIPLTSLDFKPRRFVDQFAQLVRLWRCEPPAGLVTWMYHGNLIGSAAARLAGGIPTIWNVRHAETPSQNMRVSTRAVIRLGARLSHCGPQRIIHVSESGRRWHERIGFSPSSSCVIPNGFDLDRFRFDEAASHSTRAELGCAPGVKLVGLVGRFHPNKDHKTFFEAAARLRAVTPHANFLLCGPGIDWSNVQLCKWIDQHQLRPFVHLLGQRTDMHQIYPALDVLVSSSTSEGFPNVIGEAMACGVRCVVTDVADSALIVGDCGMVVQPGDPAALGTACARLLSESPAQQRYRSERGRQRIENKFNLKVIAAKHHQEWMSLIGSGANRQHYVPIQTAA